MTQQQQQPKKSHKVCKTFGGIAGGLFALILIVSDGWKS